MLPILLILFSCLGMIVSDCTSAKTTFASCVKQIEQEAAGLGISNPTIEAALSNVQPDPIVISRDRRQPESSFDFHAYTRVFLEPERIKLVRLALQKNKKILRHVEEKFSIEPELLVALWSVETKLGEFLGHFDVVRSLATLTCDTRRPRFFRREFFAVLRLLDERRLSVSNPKGSWAGAMGQFQFLPSVIEQYGIDQDADGQFNIFEISKDAFFTAANFLNHSGWKNGLPWGYELSPKTIPPQALFMGKCDFQIGVKPSQSESICPPRNGGRMISFGSTIPRNFMVFRNFDVLLRWNRSDMFAVTVGLVFDALNKK